MSFGHQEKNSVISDSEKEQSFLWTHWNLNADDKFSDIYNVGLVKLWDIGWFCKV